jgi:hypothetical protein
MKICNKKETKPAKAINYPPLIRGNIYRLRDAHKSNQFFIAVKTSETSPRSVLASLSNGNWWSVPEHPFGIGGEKWTDVTNQVCLDTSGVTDDD